MIPEGKRVKTSDAHFDPARAAEWMERNVDVLPEGFPYKTGRRLFVLAEDYAWAWERFGRLWRLSIPYGWVWDNASIPWIAQPVAGGKNQLGLAATLIHDVLYQVRGQAPYGWLEVWVEDEELAEKGEWITATRCIQRTEADWLLWSIAIEDDTERWRAGLAWSGVRMNLRAGLDWRC